MKVKQKFFIFALILSLILSVGAVMAADDMTFDQSELKAVSDETGIELSENSISEEIGASEEETSQLWGGGETQLLGEGTSRTVDGTDFKNITKTITDSKPGDTIFLGGKTYTGNNSQINVNKDNLTIIGGSSLDDDSYATLDAQFTSRIMQVTGKNVVLKNIRFINGNTSGNGAAIYWNAVKGTIENSIFMNNFARLDGGAVYGHANSVNSTISKCTFIGNKAYNYNVENGGSVCGGGVDWRGDNFIINDSCFDNNTATNVGAAIRLACNNVTVINSNFTNNTANGGAVQLNENRVLGVIDNCIFKDNTANYGGAIYTRMGNVTLTNSIFTNNSAQNQGGAIYGLGNNNFNSINCIFENNKAHTGGAIYVNGYNNAISESTFINNTAYNVGAVDILGENSTVKNSKFYNNTARYEFAALVFAQTANNAIAENLIFMNNKALSMTGAAFASANNVTFKNCNFTNNSAVGLYAGALFIRANAVVVDGIRVLTGQNCSVLDCNFINNSAGTFAGAIHWTGANGILINSKFINNTANTHRGAVSWESANGRIENCEFYDNSALTGNEGAICVIAANVAVNGSTFVNNSARQNNGAVGWAGVNGTFTNSKFINNTAGTHSGAIYWSGANATVSDLEFINNTATTNAGALAIVGDGVVSNCTFKNNTALTGHGGAAYFYSVNLTNSHFINNYAGDSSGAVIFVAASVNSTASGCEFTNNFAQTIGGAIRWNGVNGTVTDCNFTNNVANNDGGAIRWNGVNGTLKDSKFTNNSATNFAGATNWVGSNGTMIGCTYEDNSANVGGAIEWYGANGNSRDCNFTNNHADDEGGAIRLHATAINSTMTDCNFIRNSANRTAGAVKWNSDNGTLSNCAFTNNNALDGGATDWLGVNGTLTGCTFTDNKANYTGGASLWRGANGTISNCEYTNNSAKIGGAIHSIADGLKVDGNTFKDNDAVYAGSDLSVDGPNTNLVNNKINNSGSNSSSVYVTDSANFTELGNTFSDPSKSVDYASMIIEVADSFIGHVDKTLTIPVYVHDTNGIPALGQIQLFGYGINQLTDGRTTFTIVMPKFQTTMYLTMVYEDGTYKNFMVEVADTNAPIEEAIQPDNGRDELVLHFPKDATGNVTVTINGKNYTSNVVDGFAVIEVNDIPNGNYPATLHYSGDANYSSITRTMNFTVKNSKVNPVTKILSNSDVSVIYSGNAYYKFLVTKDGKIVGAGESVTINFNGKNTVVKTDANGYINYKIPSSIKPKTYTIKATYYGSTVTNKVKITQVIKASNKKVKKSAKVTKVKITLKKVDGKFLSKKTLKIKFNKKTYKVKTNKKGVATWKVKKSMLKKLKVGKKVKYTVTYGKAVVTKKLTIKK